MMRSHHPLRLLAEQSITNTGLCLTDAPVATGARTLFVLAPPGYRSEIIARHVRGTRFGIQLDPFGLLSSRET